MSEQETDPAPAELVAGGRLARRAYAQIRAQVVRGALPSGTILNEGTLATQLGLSKTPVRQALRSLLQEGLLEIGPRRQMVVREIPPDYRQELLELRESLERIAVSHAARSLGWEQIDDLRTLLRRQRRAADAADEEEFIALDEQLHLHIAAGSGLHVVPGFLSQLRGFVRLMRLGSNRYQGHLYRVIEEHEAIVDALERRDERAALDALHAHLHTSDYVLHEGMAAEGDGGRARARRTR